MAQAELRVKNNLLRFNYRTFLNYQFRRVSSKGTEEVCEEKETTRVKFY